MGAKLTKTNPYLGTTAERKRQVFGTVSTSSAIEGVRIGANKAAKSKGGQASAKADHPKRPR